MRRWLRRDGKAGVPFLRALLYQLRTTLGPGYALECRMDGAFFRHDVLALLARAGVEYAIKVPFHPWLGLRAQVQGTRRWTRVTDRIQCAEHELTVAAWGGPRYRIVIYGVYVQHETAKNFQLDLFDPNDGHYEYSAVVTNKALRGPALWASWRGAACTKRCTGS